MSKKVLVISTGFRRNGNSDRLAQEFEKGAAEAGHEVERVSLSGKHVECCRGCDSCKKTGSCVVQDDAAELLKQLRDADTVAFATPVYFYGMCGTMKTFLDRAYSLYPDRCHIRRFRDIYLLASATETSNETVQGTIEGLKGWICCYDQARLAGVIFAGGVTEKGDIEGHPALAQAFEAGKIV